MNTGSSITAMFEIILALFLVFLNGFFVAAEFAIIKVRATRIQQMKEEGNKRALIASEVVTHLDEHLSATQLGITLASLALGWVGEPAVADLVEIPLRAAGVASPLVTHTISFVLAFGVITILHIVLGELVPKSMAISQAERMALICAPPLRTFYRLFRGPIWLLNAVANRVLRWSGFKPASEHELAHSGEELRMLVSASARGGHLDETERVLLDNVFDFSERVAREVMVPRNEMECLYVEDSFAESVAVAMEAGYTRYPVCHADKDHPVGMIHLRDLCARGVGVESLHQIMRPIMVVPETISVSRLLKEFQRQRSQMALLVDEYGGTAGLVTLEDLMEEIVGEIQDEFDDEQPDVRLIGPDTFEVDGSLLLEDAEAQLGLRLDEEEAEGVDTIGGFVLSSLASRPEVGQEVPAGGHTLEVAEVDGYRITKVRVSRTQH
ncbi:MAG TPA: hemolysin family protein [Symbiobacteriaceae bacterium]|nr:hemolysin family protein [Symbiobacteriaceae bacterium]